MVPPRAGELPCVIPDGATVNLRLHTTNTVHPSDEKGFKKTLDKARQDVPGSVMILCGGKWKEFYPELMMAAHAAILSPSSTWVYTDDWRDMKLRFSSAERTPPVVVTGLACGMQMDFQEWTLTSPSVASAFGTHGCSGGTSCSRHARGWVLLL